MPSYSAPSPEQIKTWTGVNVHALDMDEAELGTLLDELLVNAEAEVAQIVGESRFDSSSLSARQAVSLAEAVAFGVAGRWLVHPQVTKVTGTHEPHVIEDASNIADSAADLRRQSRNLARLVADGPGTAVSQVLSSSTRGCRRERTFARGRELG